MVLGEKDFWYSVVLQRGMWSLCCVCLVAKLLARWGCCTEKPVGWRAYAPPRVPVGVAAAGLSHLVQGLREVLCAIICPLILTLDPCRGPIGDWKKTWVDIPDVGQKGVIQDSVQDGRCTLIPNITPSGSVLEWWIWCFYLGFWGQGIHWNRFRVKKVAGNGEF